MRHLFEKDFLRRAAARGRRDPARAFLGLYAAGGTYYLCLSLAPLTALLLAALPYTAVTEGELVAVLLRRAPAPLGRVIYAAVREIYARPTAALGLSAVTELWSGARFLAGVVRGIGELQGGRRGGYLRRRAMGAAYTVLLEFFVLGYMTVLLWGGRLPGAAGRLLPGTEFLWKLLLRLRGPLFLAALTAGNALLFRYAPGGGPRIGDRVPGALFSAGCWLLFCRLYSAALERCGAAGVYGGIAAAAMSLYWAYVSLYILFLGAWLNVILEEGGAVKTQEQV